MDDTKYNGWTNYETWLVGLHLGEVFYDMAEAFVEQHRNDCDMELPEAQSQLADELREFFYENIMPDRATTNALVWDLLADSRIDWRDLAETYLSDACDNLEHQFTNNEGPQE